MENNDELEDLRTRQRRQRETIEAALNIKTQVEPKREHGTFDTREIYVRRVADDMLGPHAADLEKLEKVQALRAVKRMVSYRIQHLSQDWTSEAADRLRDQMPPDDEDAGRIDADDVKARPLLDVLLLLQAADVIGQESAGEVGQN